MRDEGQGGPRVGLGGRRHLPVVLVLCAGILLSLAVFLSLRAQDRSLLEAQFNVHAAQYAALLQNGIELNLAVIRAAGALHAHPDPVGRRAFETFINDIRTGHRAGEVQVLAWAPRVPHTGREAFEEAARASGLAGFRINERNGSGESVPAGRRDAYFPIRYLVPMEGHERALGFDIASEAVRREGLERARDSGEKVTTGRIVSAGDPGGRGGVLVLRPVYAPGLPVDSVEARREALAGFVVGLLYVDVMVESTVGIMQPPRIADVAIHDESASPQHRLLHATGPPDGGGIEGIRVRAPLYMPGREWMAVITPTPEYLDAHLSQHAFHALWAGLLATAVLGLLVAFRERGRARIEQAHREWLDAFDAVRHPIFLHDRKGRLLRANRAYAERAGLDYRRLIGRRYWEVFPHRDQPLPACRLELETTGDPEGESTAEALDEVVLDSGEILLSRAFAVRDDAGRYRYSIHAMEDITEQRRAQESLWRHVEFQDIVRNISNRFLKLGADGTDDGIDAALRELGTHVGVDRCYLFRFSDDGARLDNTHEWCAEGIAPQMPSLHDLQTADLGWMMARLRRFEPILVPRVADLPAASAERAHFEAGGIQSLLMVPVVLGDRLTGFIGFDRVRREEGWDEFEVRLLQDAATTIAYALAQREADRALQRVDRLLVTLSHANAALVHAGDEDELLRRICDIIVADGGFRAAWVGYGVPDGGLRMRACAGDCCARIEAMAQRGSGEEGGRCPCGLAIHSGQTQVFNEIPADVHSAPWAEDMRACGIGSAAALPLLADGETFGALNVHADEPGILTGAVIEHLEELARDLSYGLGSLRIRAERDQAHGALGETLLQTVEAVARVVEMRDPYTSGHQRRVSDLASAIAAELGLDAQRIEGVRVGALLHDIGKIAVPAEILTRPGRLSDMEYGMIKGHAQVGHDILRDVSFPWPVREMILQHHERLDGSGYPNGLKGGGIVLEARIITVADVVEAMTTHRPYRAGLGIDKALAEIEQGRGNLYDPAAVDACLRLFHEKGFQWE